MMNEIKIRLESLGYRTSIHKNHSKGEIRYNKGIKLVYNKDYYALEVYRKLQTLELINILPIRHPEKIAKRELMFRIYKKNIVHWDKVKIDVMRIRELIEESVQLKKELDLSNLLE